ncbi:MAG: hypothetical protein JRD68_00200 [Deltaproteobacteria bacterium]|nr:hypothetical protein [Deltaproteobacteria bacterium]
MKSEKSCLTCKFGKPEKQPEGYWCFDPEDEEFDDGEPYYHKGKNPCWNYEPRLNQCEIDGCEFMDAVCQRGDAIVGLNPILSGKKCVFFEKEEPASGIIEFRDKKYKWTGKRLDFKRLKKDADSDPHSTTIIARFASEFDLIEEAITYTQTNISVDPEMIEFALATVEVIPWLVDKGYLVEVAEEVKQFPNQWYKGNSTGALYYSDIRLNLVNISNGYHHHWSDKVLVMTPIPPPIITEQPQE